MTGMPDFDGFWEQYPWVVNFEPLAQQTRFTM